MKKRKFLVFFITLVCSFSMGLIAQTFAQSKKKKTTPTLSNQSKANDDYALAKFKEMLGNIFSKCGDTYYTEVTREYETKTWNGQLKGDKKTSVTTYGLKGYNLKFEPIGSNEAAKLNGIEWRGRAFPTFTVYKTYTMRDDWTTKAQKNGWSEWANIGLTEIFANKQGWTLWGEKKNSSWQFGDYNYQDNSAFRESIVSKKVSCSEIPK